MVSPIFAFGAPMYYGGVSGYSTVSTQVYQDDGSLVRNFFTNDGAGYLPNPFLTYFRTPPRNSLLFDYYMGGGSSRSNSTNEVKPKENSSKLSNPEQKRSSAVSVKTTEVTNPFSPKPKVHQKPKSSNESINLGKSFISVANKYIDCNEDDGSHVKFCINPTCEEEDPYNQEWCTDFVTYVVKESYKKAGITLPKGFGDHDVETLKNWAIKNNMFIRTAGRRDKKSFIINNIKPGDIFILNQGDASHTGFVTEVNRETGEIYTIEGNRDDMVKNFSYSYNDSNLSGFIRLKP